MSELTRKYFRIMDPNYKNIIKPTNRPATVWWPTSSYIDTHDIRQTRPLFAEQHLHLSLGGQYSLIAEYV